MESKPGSTMLQRPFQDSASGVQCADDAELLAQGSSVVQESPVGLQVLCLISNRATAFWEVSSKLQYSKVQYTVPK